MADVLRWVPGLNVESTGREGEITSVFTRGGESDYNHVLIDGVRVNDDGGAYDFGRISAAEIDRVEVVRGAQSALYGSDAIGSVVQVFTKRGTPDSGPRQSGSFEGGSFGTTRGDLRVLGGAAGRTDYQLGVAHRATDGAFRDRLPEPDRFDQQSVDGNAGAIVGNDTRLRTGFRYSDARGTSVGPITYARGDTGTGYDTDSLTWRLGFDQVLSPRIGHSATVSYFRSGRRSVDTAGDPQNRVFAILEGEPGALFPAGPRLVRLLDQAAGAEVTFDDQRWLARFTWFGNDYEDQIAWSPSPGFGGDGLPDYVNIDGSRADGVELELAMQRPLGGLTASASYALVDTEVVTNAGTSEQFQPGQPLLRRPRHSGNVRVGYARGRGSLHLNVRVAGDRHDSAFLGLQRVGDGRGIDITVNPGYTLVAAGGQLRVRPELTLFLRIDNLTDAVYDSALGYPGLPRAFVAGGRFGFGG